MVYLTAVFFLCVSVLSSLCAQEAGDDRAEWYIEDFSTNDDVYITDDCGCDCQTQDPLFHKFALGPQIYNVNRRRAGGSRQTGMVYGLRACYDRVRPWGIYWGAEIWYGQGHLDGKTPAGSHLKSNFLDRQIEGRLGFTFQGVQCHHPSFTPFLGYGFFEEINKYRPPTPLSLKFRNSYEYISVGFLSSLDINAWLQIGLNLKGRVLWNGATCRVSGDPEFTEEKMPIGTRFNYRVELPLLYQNCGESYRWGCGLVPFVERRHYGGTESFPHDFVDTKLNLYGVIIEVTYQL